MSRKRVAAELQFDERSARDALLDAAGAEMIDKQTPNVSLQAIASRAGLTAPLTTYYFKTKEGLLLALLRRDTEGPLAQLEELIRSDMPAHDLLRIHISGVIRNYARRPYLNQLLNVLLRDEESPSAAVIRDNFVLPLAAAQRAIIERGIATGEFRPVDPALAYFLILGACQGLFMNRITRAAVLGAQPDDETVRKYTEMVHRFVLGSLSPEPQSQSQGPAPASSGGSLELVSGEEYRRTP